MDSSGILQKHWLNVLFDFALDALIFALAIMVGAHLRFETGDEFLGNMLEYLPSVTLGAVFLSSTIYIFGLYSQRDIQPGVFRRMLILAACLLITFGFMMLLFYANYSGRVGRGVMAIAVPILYILLLVHHGLIRRRLSRVRERIAFLITSPYDESECRLLLSLDRGNLEFVGIAHARDFKPTLDCPILGCIDDLPDIAQEKDLNRVLCSSKCMHDSTLYKEFCRLRYSGVGVLPLISLCEEIHQLAPVELITPEWLMHASASPHVFYLQKIKRAFDIVCSLAGLVFLGPVLLLGMTWGKLVSRGPVLFRQVRSGRFGRHFEVIKLRTMRLDAEKDGAVWASAKDPRVIPCGNLLRKFRIDEIPQLVNVLRGEMSFVGPRPERPEFVETLSAEIPYFQERLMALPGITGWAQVNYPYGASVEDARRKLEYDLYYMRHMSVFLDLFILLDTIRIILRGGARRVRDIMPNRSENTAQMMDSGSSGKDAPDSTSKSKPAKERPRSLKIATEGSTAG